MKNILVGLDFDDKTDLLLEKAGDLAKKFEAKLWLLHVASPLPDYAGIESIPSYSISAREKLVRDEQNTVQNYAKKLSKKGVQAEGIMLEGATIDIILNQAEKMHVDLIVCGHHEHNFLYNMIFGSVSSSLVRRSKTPVLVYPLG
jgi:nucleotide-binding universal stress UspA family protein